MPITNYLLCEDKTFTAFEVNRCLYQFTWIPFGETNGVANFPRAIDKFVGEENLTNTLVYFDKIAVTGRDQAEYDKCVKRFLEAAQCQNLTLNDSKSILSASNISVLGYEINDEFEWSDKSRLRPLLDN